MQNAKQKLGDLVRIQREHRQLSQESLAKIIHGANRSNIAHLEQGLRVPKPELLELICRELDLPGAHWRDFLDPEIQARLDFEEHLSELTGEDITLDGHDETSYRVANESIKKLFQGNNSSNQTHDLFNSILIFYGIRPTSQDFFNRYLGAQRFSSMNVFGEAVQTYQRDAIRLFSTLTDAYRVLSASETLVSTLMPIQVKDTKAYSERAAWATPHEIPEERLADLGYISAARVKQEKDEREALKQFLIKLAAGFREQKNPVNVIDDIPEKTKRRMDSLLRKFNSHFQHGLFSPLFAPDADEIIREAERIAPKTDSEIERMDKTQTCAMENLSFYLASDFLDVYVATSMRTDADFVSVNSFVKRLFSHETSKPLKLRYFNPTQSWIEDRIAKGLVEALMLKRASITIYMAQKSDTFGKDSEASVALGQGKPVIVYVPRLSFPDGIVDTEQLFLKSRSDLLSMLSTEERNEIDEDTDEQGLFAKVLTSRLLSLDDGSLSQIAFSHWADFDLVEEQHRIPEEYRENYRAWLAAAISGKNQSLGDIKEKFIGILTANAISFERRAKLFREIHPLALQVILFTGVLNGILVVRTVDQCAEILSRLIKNELELTLVKDEKNYRLVEKITSSTIRVISRHRLLLNAFATHYGRP